MKAAFKVFDHNNDGSISRQERRMVRTRDEDEDADEDDDVLSREELREAMMNFGTRCTDE